ncbi:MAG: hypothetical protein ACI4L9_00160 [Candidatus Coproplasma sp.]
MDAVKYDDLASDTAEERSASVKARVERARAIQRERFRGEDISVNANMGERQIKKYCKLTYECEAVLKNAFISLSLSARARSRIIKVARTIADLDACEQIKPEHVLEATAYRNFDVKDD